MQNIDPQEQEAPISSQAGVHPFDDYLALDVVVRSKTLAKLDQIGIRVWPGQRVRQQAAEAASGYGAEVVEIRHKNGTMYRGRNEQGPSDAPIRTADASEAVAGNTGHQEAPTRERP